jgi:uncharacterized membrane protein
MQPGDRNGAAIAIAACMMFTLGIGAAFADAPKTLTAGYENCFGVAKAGRNDCRSGRHVCAGRQRIDRDPASFIQLPVGTCEKIAGGSLVGTLPTDDQ